MNSHPNSVPKRYEELPSCRWRHGMTLPAFLEVRDAGAAGRGIFAVEPITCGALIFSEKPIMWTFHRSAKWSRCRYCFGACAAAVEVGGGCASCGEVRWCSWKCREMDEGRHALECSLLKALASLKVPLEVRENVALLISLRASNASNAATAACVAALMAEPLGRPGAKRRARCRGEAVKVFGRLLQEQATDVPDEVVKSEAASALAAMPLNAFGFWDAGTDDGHCLVPTASFFNHSCAPNCLHRVEEGHVKFYALRDIASNEELTFSYIDEEIPPTERKDLIFSMAHCQVSHIGSILQSCAQMHWRDEHLLCGLTEAFRCACELRRGSVRDYSVILQALRRLNYCPWVGALRPIIQDLRWRLRKHRWRPLDLVLALRFVAGFQVQHLPQVRAEGLALCRELRSRAEQRMGEMRHLELAHFARALVVLNQSGLPEPRVGWMTKGDTILLERVADNFSRRAGELPLGALLHMCSTLLTAKADAPSEFRAVLVEKAQADAAVGHECRELWYRRLKSFQMPKGSLRDRYIPVPMRIA
eukprot:s144_g22.t4